MRRARTTILAVSLGLAAHGARRRRPAGLADHVNPFAGTRPGPGDLRRRPQLPRRDACPSGWSSGAPTRPPPHRTSGGYDYRDNHTSGLQPHPPQRRRLRALRRLPLPADDRAARPPRRPQPAPRPRRRASSPASPTPTSRRRPGFYSVRLNPVRGAGIDVALTATTRTGMARFTFPANPHSSVLIDAGGSAQPDDFAAVDVDPEPPRNLRHRLQRPLLRPAPALQGLLRRRLRPPLRRLRHLGGRARSTRRARRARTTARHPRPTHRRRAQAGAYASFDTRRNRVVTARVGVSFVSVEDARANLAAENPGRRLRHDRRRAPQRRWNQALGRIRVSGGPSASSTPSTRRSTTPSWRRGPSATSAATTSAWTGCSTAPRGRIQYADFSGWDIYRTRDPAALDAGAASGPATWSARCSPTPTESGCLPRWPYANGQSMTMVGDSADPIIASAAAFGAGAFDRRRGAGGDGAGAPTQPCRSANGEYLERQGLAQYLALGYVPFDLDTNIRNANSIYGSPERRLGLGGDHARVRGRRLRDRPVRRPLARATASTYRRFMRAPRNWRRLFDPASGMIEPRYADGAFPSPYDNLQRRRLRRGRLGPVHLDGPAGPGRPDRARWAGRAKAAARLDRFLRELNGGPGGTHTDHALLGNEPTLQTPWLYDWMRPALPDPGGGPPRPAASTAPTPDGYPGNDDLGTLSAWYVFGALGLYPEVPGVGVLAIGSPLFAPGRRSRLPHRRRVTDPRLGARGDDQRHGKKRQRQVARSARRRPLHPVACASTATPTPSPGPPTAPSPAGPTLTFQLGRPSQPRLGHLRRRAAAILRARRDAEPMHP